MYEQPGPPSSVFRLLGVAAVGSLLTAVAGITLISSGRFDPLTRELPEIDPSVYILTVAPEQRTVRWTAHTFADEGQLHVVARWHDGTQDLSYGLLLGDDAAFLEISASPNGQLSVTRFHDGLEEVVLPPQPWPHLSVGAEANEFEVVFHENLVGVWINRELAWEGTVELLSGKVGLFASAKNDAGSIRFSEIGLLTPD